MWLSSEFVLVVSPLGLGSAGDVSRGAGRDPAHCSPASRPLRNSHYYNDHYGNVLLRSSDL